MTPTLTCLALAVVGVDLGYRPTTNGRVEFIIQISPSMLQTLRPGDPIELDADAGAQTARPSHFVITTGNGPLPHELPPNASVPPATAPIVAATPVLPTGATVPTLQDGTPSNNLQRYGGPPSPSAAHPGPLEHLNQGGLLSPTNSASGRYPELGQVGANSNPSQLDHPWLGMVLLVIFLAAGNGYLGWLFWDVRQRYLGLVARTFATARQSAEA
jgi:hypothetical protein